MGLTLNWGERKPVTSVTPGDWVTWELDGRRQLLLVVRTGATMRLVDVSTGMAVAMIDATMGEFGVYPVDVTINVRPAMEVSDGN